MTRTTRILLALALGAVPGATLAAPAPFTVTASAALPDEGPDRLIDGYAGRPWIAPFDPAAPPSVTLDLGNERWVAQVRFIPGHALSTQSFDRYARPARVRVAWDGGERAFTLHDRRTRQVLDLGHLVVTTRLVVTIEDTFGPAAMGVAIADMSLIERHDPSGSQALIYQRMARFLEALSDDAGYERAQHYLVRFGDKAATPLMRLVAGHDTAVAARALEALVELGGDEAKAVVGELLAGGPEQVAMALTVLQRHPLAAFEETLTGLASGSDPVLVRAAFRALAATGSSRARTAVTAAIRGPAGLPRDAAVGALGCLPSAEALAVVRSLLTDRDPTVGERALAALGPVAQRDPAALAFLVDAARGDVPGTQVAALSVLAQVPAPETRALLIDLMTHAKPRVARAAVTAFLAQDPDGEVYLAAHMDELRPAAIEHAVGLTRDRDTASSTQFLVRALASGVWEPWYGHAAELLAMRHEDGAGAVVRWLIAQPKDERIVRHFLIDQAALAAPAAVEVLAQVRRSRVHTDVKLLLLEVLRDSGLHLGADVARAFYIDSSLEVQVRRAAFDTLTSVAEGPEVEHMITAALDSDDDQTRRIAYLAVSKHHMESALPRVQREIDGTRPDEWSPGMVMAYGDLGGEPAMERLKEHYPVAPQSTRHAIMDTAWRSGSVQGIELLVDAVSSQDRDTRRYALALLEQQR